MTAQQKAARFGPGAAEKSTPDTRHSTGPHRQTRRVLDLLRAGPVSTRQLIERAPERRGEYASREELARAVEILSLPLKDRPRWLEIHGKTLLLGDDSGGERVESFDDVTAVYFFLLWLRHSRAEMVREAVASERRAKLRMVRGKGAA